MGEKLFDKMLKHTLNVVIEHAVLVLVSVEQSICIRIAEILELNQSVLPKSAN